MRNFKKVLSMVLVLVMALSTLALVPLTTSADEAPAVTLRGQGTAANPFLVGSAAELAAAKAAITWHKEIREGSGEVTVIDWPYDAIYIKLTADIEVPAGFQLSVDASVYGSVNTQVAWIVDGDDHTISGLTVPLFGAMSRAPEAHQFRDLTVSGTVSSGERYVGIITGATYGDILFENVTTEGSVTTTKGGSNVHVGAFVGLVSKYSITIRDCVNNAAVTNVLDGQTDRSAGGFVGAMGHYTDAATVDQFIEFSTNNGAISCSGDAGGLVGRINPNAVRENILYTADIYNCLNTGAVTGAVAGAIAGKCLPQSTTLGAGSFNDISILECYTTVADLAIYDADASAVVITEGTESITNVAAANVVTRNLRNYTAAEAADEANKAALDVIKARMDQTVYEIDSLRDLEDLKDIADFAILGTAFHVKFTGDVDMRENGETGKFEFTTSIYGGKEIGQMRWVIDGEGHKMYNKVTPFFAGLDQVRGGQIIRNLTIEADADELKDADRYFAAFVGCPYGDLLIENCTVTGMIKCTRNDAKDICVGAFIGLVNANGPTITLNNCANLSVVRAPVSNGKNETAPKSFVGGLIGRICLNNATKGDNLITVKNCLNAGDLWNKNTTGGLIGQITADFVGETTAEGSMIVNIENCVNAGNKYSSVDNPDTPDKDETAALSPGNLYAFVGALNVQLGETNTAAVNVKNCYNTAEGLTLNGTVAADYFTMTDCYDATAAADEANAAAIAAIHAQAVHTHIYLADCDVDCDSCYATRTDVAAHVYDNETCDVDCNNCGAEREVTHNYENACDADCNTEGCGATRTPAAHVYANGCDADCNVCGATRAVGGHEYDNACDAYCNLCDEERTVDDHVYDNACDGECNVCGNTRTPDDHVYDNACDTKCNVCDAERETEHVYDNDCDAKCNVCEAERAVPDHVYDDEKDATCNVCGAEREIKADTPDTGDTTTKAPDTTTKAPEEEKRGCGSALNSTYAIIALVAVLGFAFVAKKREEN